MQNCRCTYNSDAHVIGAFVRCPINQETERNVGILGSFEARKMHQLLKMKAVMSIYTYYPLRTILDCVF